MSKHKAGDPADFPQSSRQPDATIRVGPHQIIIPRAAFEAWEAKLTADVGFSKPAIALELRRRLVYD